MLTIEQLYDLNHTLAADYLRQFTYPWEALAGIKAEILRIGAALDPAEYTEVSEHVWVHKTATVAPTAYLGAPCIIGARTEVRHCAFIRGSALVGADCVVGNSVELKNVILFDRVQTPHYNYVGDSILGYCSHMGGGVDYQQREERQDAGDGSRRRRKYGNRLEENGGNAWRLCGSRLQQRAEPRHGYRAGEPNLPAELRAW